MEVATGKIRAISNLTRLEEGNYAEVLNYAVGTKVEPGSTFKFFSDGLTGRWLRDHSGQC